MRVIRRIVLFLLLIAVFSGTVHAAGEAPVIIVQVKGEIDSGQAALVHRALADAKLQGARAILMEIDTFGGLVDAAVQIRDRIGEADVPTICYIKNRAWSAGALIALAHKQIVMAPGGSIGAAEPIPTTEKTVAALKAEFAATANKTGRNPAVAEAMVDKSLGFPGYAEPGKILALTDYQAIKVGYAEAVLADRQQVLARYGLDGAPVQEYNMGWTERLVGWLSNSTVKSMLLSVLFLAIMAEIKMAGVGVAAATGLVAALLFFGSQWLIGVAGMLELLLFLGGLALIALEFFTPGMTIFGLGGVFCILVSIFLTLGGNFGALTTLAVSLAVSLLLFLLLVRHLPSSRLWNRLVLKDAEKTEAGYTSVEDFSNLTGRRGTALTLLRPAGSVDIDGRYLDVVADGQFIEAGATVEVVAVSGRRIVVRQV